MNLDGFPCRVSQALPDLQFVVTIRQLEMVSGNYLRIYNPVFVGAIEITQVTTVKILDVPTPFLMRGLQLPHLYASVHLVL